MPPIKKHKPLGLGSYIEPYDILQDLDAIQPTIIMKQLLVVSLECRTTLTSSLVRRRQRNKEIHEVSLNPDLGAPTIDVSIDGVLISGVQVDGGSSVNLMTADTMEKLGLTNLLSTELLLQMVDHSKVLPMGVLINVDTNIAGIDYVVFQLKSLTLSYPILLGCHWLFDAKARNDWGRGTLTIGKQHNKIVLQMYPVTYHEESQLPRTEFTSDDVDSDLDDNEDTSYGDEQFGPIQSHSPKTGAIYQCCRPCEYLIHQDDIDNSDRAIARWMNNYAIYQISAMERELDSTNLSEFVIGSEPDK